MTVLAIAVAAGACTFAAATLVLRRLERERIRRLIAPRVRAADPAEPEPTTEGRRLVLRLERLYGLTERRLGATRPWGALERLAARADLALRPVELLWLCLGGGLLAALLFVALTGALAVLVLLPLLALGFAWLFLVLRAGRRLRAFDDQLPELLGELGSSLRAGHSLSQALQVLAEDAAEPAREELRRVVASTRLGRPLEDALAELNERIPSKELRYALTAIAIQRQVGGSLASLFDLVATTVQERQRFERKVRSLTASGRMSAYVLTALPFGLAAILSAINPGYLGPLLASPTGRLLVAAALVLMAVGGLMLKKMVSVKGVST